MHIASLNFASLPIVSSSFVETERMAFSSLLVLTLTGTGTV